MNPHTKSTTKQQPVDEAMSRTKHELVNDSWIVILSAILDKIIRVHKIEIKWPHDGPSRLLQHLE